MLAFVVELNDEELDAVAAGATVSVTTSATATGLTAADIKSTTTATATTTKTSEAGSLTSTTKVTTA